MIAPSHLLSLDVEDWPQSMLDHSLPISATVVANTHALLELLDATGVQTTFFVVGKMAEAHLFLGHEIAAAGHKVGTHGYSHEST